MKKKLALATLAIIPMATNNVHASNVGTVTASSLNVRSGPGTSYSVVTNIKKNEKVEILQTSNGWYKIKTTSGREGWASTSYISSNSNLDNNDNSSSTNAIVNTNGLKFRNGAGTSYSIIKVLNKGEKVEVISESNGWSKVKYNSRLGYVASKYIDKTNVGTITVKEVNIEGLNVRSGPSTSYPSIGKLNKGLKVEVISESAGWSKINYNNKVGYISSGYLKSISTSNPSVPNTKPDEGIQPYKEKKIVNTEGLNVRTGPATTYSSICKLKKGLSVEVVSESNGWSKINYNNKAAYVYTKYLDRINENEQTPPTNIGGESVDNVNGASIHYKGLNYTLENHIDIQYKKAVDGGNVISSSKPRSSDTLTTFSMIQSRSFIKADKSDLEYFLNPKNFTNSKKGMLQFLRTDSYKGGISENELNSYLNSLPKINGKDTVFYNQGNSFINAAKKYNIDLVYLVSHAMWETGYGKSILAQGQTITSYKGQKLPNTVTVYNFFGIGAIDKSANVSGAEASYSNGWTSIEKTIEGSAKWISENYIHSSKYSQNTIYKMKFNYDYSFHQYATDVNWANGISGVMHKLIDMYDSGNNLKFEIPNYK